MSEQLTAKHCVPCEGGVPKLSKPEAEALLKQVPEWKLEFDHPSDPRIVRSWRVKNFVQAVEFLKRVTTVAESEGHHPDFHLERYRNVRIEIYTHAIGGLSENDFILAAKIDQLPIE